MIKRVCIFFVLAILCVFSVLGTGFALWSFDNQSVATQNMGVHVTQSAVLGRFEVPEIKHVILDGGTGAGINPTITGVSFYKADENNVAVTDNSFTIRFQVKEAYWKMIQEEWTKDNNCPSVHFGIRINVPQSLSTLIAHTDFYNSHMQANGFIDLKALTIELTDHFTSSTNKDFDYDPTNHEFTFALTTTTLNRFFTYLSATKPTELERYENLNGNFAPLFVIELWQGYSQTTA